jgi:hypothetical protein
MLNAPLKPPARPPVKEAACRVLIVPADEDRREFSMAPGGPSRQAIGSQAPTKDEGELRLLAPGPNLTDCRSVNSPYRGNARTQPAVQTDEVGPVAATPQVRLRGPDDFDWPPRASSSVALISLFAQERAKEIGLPWRCDPSEQASRSLDCFAPLAMTRRQVSAALTLLSLTPPSPSRSAAGRRGPCPRGNRSRCPARLR